MRNLELKDIFAGNCYHICTNGQESPVIMKCDDDYKVALNYLALLGWKYGIGILAYCLMSNHVHILIICRNREEAQRFIRSFKRLYSAYLLNRYGQSDTLRGIKDSITLIDSVQYLRNCIAYILRNGLSAGICMRIEDYPWSSHSCYFNTANSDQYRKVEDLGEREKRSMFKTRQNLKGCPYLIDRTGKILDRSFVRHDLVEKAFNNSGKFFLLTLGICNDAQMEYEMACRPLIGVNDGELIRIAERTASERFKGRSIPDLSSKERCSMIKTLYFNNKTTIPQLSRILGLPRALVTQILGT